MRLLFRTKVFLLTISVSFLFFGCTSTTQNVDYKYYPETANEKIIDNKAMHKAKMKKYTVNGITYYPKNVDIGETFEGIASWYGPNFHGKLTSNGETYNQNALTAAHKTFPMNTMVKVTRLDNGKIIVVRINDRGPFVAGRIIDLSFFAGKRIGLDKDGTTPVRLEILGFNSTVSELINQQYNNKPEEIIAEKITEPVIEIKKAQIITKPIIKEDNNEIFKMDTIIPIEPIIVEPIEIKTEPVKIEEPFQDIKNKIEEKIEEVKSVLDIENKEKYETGFAIQVGAFRNRIGAISSMKKFNSSLVDGKYKSIVKELVLDNIPIYKVWFVGFSSKDEAKYFLQNHSEFQGSFILTNK